MIQAIPKKGDRGTSVVALQKALNSQGYALILDGVFGNQTAAAVSSFQKKKGLPGSGIIGPKTMSLLGLTAGRKEIEGLKFPTHYVSGLRNLELELEKIYDNFLWKSYRSQTLGAIQSKNGNHLVHLASLVMPSLMIREATGRNDGYEVELVQETIGRAENEAYCMSSYQSCVAWAEKKLGVQSKILASESTVSTALGSPKELLISVEDSVPGCAWIWRHGTAWRGHVGTFSYWIQREKLAVLAEGNTTYGVADDGKIVSEGGGFYMTQRTAGQIGDMKLIAVVKPF